MIRKIISGTRSSQGLQQSVLMVIGNSLATGLSAIALIFISRQLGPTNFGEFSVGFAVVLILLKVNELGLNAALLKFVSSSTDQTDKQAYFSQTLRYKLIITGVLIIVGLGLIPLVQSIFHFNHPWILVAAVSLGLVGVYYEQLQYMLQALHRFPQAVAINALQAGTKLLGALLLFSFKIESSFIVFIVYISAPLVPVLMSSKLLPDWVELKVTTQSKQIRSNLLDMARHSSVAFISAGVIENIDVLFVQGFLSSYEAGLLGGVSRIALLFNLIAYSLGNVLFPRVARYQSKDHLSSYIKKALIISLLAIIGFILFLPFSRVAILLTIGPEYMPGISILNILVLSSFMTIAVIPLQALFYSFKESWYFSVSGILQLVIVLIGNSFYVPVFGLEAAAWTRLIARLVLLIFTMIVGLGIYWRKYLVNKS